MAQNKSSKDQAYDAGNEKHVADAKRREHNETQEKVNNLAAIMSTKEGRAVMWDLLSRCGVFHESFNIDTHIMAKNEGRRCIGLEYIELLTTHCLVNYQLMEKEQRNKRI